jgi:hypothetical protein
MGKQTGPSMGVRDLFKGWQLGFSKPIRVFKTLTAHPPSPPGAGAGAAPSSQGAGDPHRPGLSPYRAVYGEQPRRAGERRYRTACAVGGPRVEVAPASVRVLPERASRRAGCRGRATRAEGAPRAEASLGGATTQGRARRG